MEGKVAQLPLEDIRDAPLRLRHHAVDVPAALRPQPSEHAFVHLARARVLALAGGLAVVELAGERLAVGQGQHALALRDAILRQLPLVGAAAVGVAGEERGKVGDAPPPLEQRPLQELRLLLLADEEVGVGGHHLGNLPTLQRLDRPLPSVLVRRLCELGRREPEVRRAHVP